MNYISDRAWLSHLSLLATLLFGVNNCSLAQSDPLEIYKSIRAPNAVAAIGNDLFGDSNNLFNGSLQFTQMDVSIPGNSALPVAVGRRINTGEVTLGGQPFGKWEMDIPHISGTFSGKVGWVAQDGTRNRCSQFGPPPDAVGANGTSVWDPSEFWRGTFMYIPGEGTQQLLIRDAANPVAPGPVLEYPAVTTRFWSLSCIPIKNGTALGQGFIAVSPTGIKYYFDWLVNKPATTLQKAVPWSIPSPTAAKSSEFATASRQDGGVQPAVEVALVDAATPLPSPDRIASPGLGRTEVWLLPSKVVDRFGNYVNYTYDAQKPGNLVKIESNDSRVITIAYNATGQVQTVSDGTALTATRTWTYSYHTNPDGKLNLDKVTLPDNSVWNYQQFDSLLSSLQLVNDGGCDDKPFINNLAATGTIVHPSGATGTFTISPTIHGRSHVFKNCPDIIDAPRHLETPRYFATLSLTRKALTGPGIGTMAWTYDYGPTNESWSTCPNCISTKTVTVTDPAGQVNRFTFGNEHNVSEGMLQLSETGWDGTSSLRSTIHRYRPFGAGPYPEFMGIPDSANSGDGYLAARLAPEEERVTTQQGVTFTWRADLFDKLARPTKVFRGSSHQPARNETYAFQDDIANYVMGPLKSVTVPSDTDNSSKVMLLNEYSANGALSKVSKFGKVQVEYDRNPDGTVLYQRDGKNPAYVFTNYKRGIPRNTQAPDLSKESVVVNNMGKITSHTDQNSVTTSYVYDAMGRVKAVMPPTTDTVAWNTTTSEFEFVPTAEYDLGSGHWRQTVKTGSSSHITVFDALMRPSYSYSADVTNTAATGKFIKSNFDFNGSATFTSYPARDFATLNGGVTTKYDALGRVTAVEAQSELGLITTTKTYEDDFKTTSRDGRGNASTASYQVFDEPVESAISEVVAPEGAIVSIPRDMFGKPQSIARSGNGKSAIRTYVYDVNERLCKTIEPETGATVQAYDLANNIVMRASGLNLPSATCDNDIATTPAAKSTIFAFDANNRLSTTTYGDLSPSISRTYYPDGAPKTVESGGANWTYTYNKLGALKTETLAYAGANYQLAYTYDANGALTQLKYPDTEVVAYLPNALGEPTQVGTYASQVAYYPNGAISGFKYGNGIVHSLGQNIRGLPERSSDAGVHNDAYTYDENANVKSIRDDQGSITSRTMDYDGLDRLKTVSAPALWGNASYQYDTLDNLTNSSLTGGAGIARTMVHEYDANNRLWKITGTAGFAFDYGYDSQGNITSRGAQTYAFDQANRMKSAAGKGTYLYDGLGRRMSVVGTDGINRVSIYSASGKLLYVTTTTRPATGTKYIYLHKHVIAEVTQ